MVRHRVQQRRRPALAVAAVARAGTVILGEQGCVSACVSSSGGELRFFLPLPHGRRGWASTLLAAVGEREGVRGKEAPRNPLSPSLSPTAPMCAEALPHSDRGGEGVAGAVRPPRPATEKARRSAESVPYKTCL